VAATTASDLAAVQIWTESLAGANRQQAKGQFTPLTRKMLYLAKFICFLSQNGLHQ
jgi:hypothetical protein